MVDLNPLLTLHKKTVLVAGNGLSVECLLKQNNSHEGYPLRGYSNFTGLTFDDNGQGFFGDVFELTLDINDVREKTNLIPVAGWLVTVKFPQMNNDQVTFAIENIAIDRTLGLYLLRCSAATSAGQGKKVYRRSPGGI
jgi:hypothetical protein